MARFRLVVTKDGTTRVPYTPAEEAARDAEEAQAAIDAAKEAQAQREMRAIDCKAKALGAEALGLTALAAKFNAEATRLLGR